MVQPIEQVISRQRQPGEASASIHRQFNRHIMTVHQGLVDPNCEECKRLALLTGFKIRQMESTVPKLKTP